MSSAFGVRCHWGLETVRWPSGPVFYFERVVQHLDGLSAVLIVVFEVSILLPVIQNFHYMLNFGMSGPSNGCASVSGINLTLFCVSDEPMRLLWTVLSSLHQIALVGQLITLALVLWLFRVPLHRSL